MITKFSKLRSRACFSSLVVAQTLNGKASQNVYNVLSAAAQFEGDTDVLVPGVKSGNIPDQLKKSKGVTRILSLDHQLLRNPQPTHLGFVVESLHKKQNYSQILAPATTFGKDLLPRVGGILGYQPITDVIKIRSGNEFERPIYAGNAICTVKSEQLLQLLTIRPTNFEKIEAGESETASVEELKMDQEIERGEAVGLKFEANHVSDSERPDLTAARYVVSGGRGLKNGENFKLLYDFAEVLGGKKTAVGASRAAVDAGFVPNELQVGQTGKVVAPELYFAIGISGAIQHLAGMKDSKVIVAINKDPEAAIFQVANYGLVGDLFKVMPELTEKLAK